MIVTSLRRAIRVPTTTCVAYGDMLFSASAAFGTVRAISVSNHGGDIADPEQHANKHRAQFHEQLRCTQSRLACVPQDVFDPPVWNQPDQRQDHK